ncbi:hypothetical protein LDENG_00051730 [Lucifuga dentata]|nr:hypothetical protein LDENG_00051730 [Lucifuga dentata]
MKEERARAPLPLGPSALREEKPLRRSCDGDLNASPAQISALHGPVRSAQRAAPRSFTRRFVLESSGVRAERRGRWRNGMKIWPTTGWRAVHLATAGPYPPHQYTQSTHSSSVAAAAGDTIKRDKDAIYGYDEFTDPLKKNRQD